MSKRADEMTDREIALRLQAIANAGTNTSDWQFLHGLANKIYWHKS